MLTRWRWHTFVNFHVGGGRGGEGGGRGGGGGGGGNP